MEKRKGYSKKDETTDAEVADFLLDVDIALGHDYQQPGRPLFPQFSPQFHTIASNESPLFERLARAYDALENSQKSHARSVVQKALALCARSPQGLRRTLVCVDLAHAIDPALGSEALYGALMLRPTDKFELAEWLWQLVRRWYKWNIRVESTCERWEKAIRSVAPKGILDMVLYFHAQNARDDPGCWNTVRRIALQRIANEENALIDVGHDAEILRQRISALVGIDDPDHEPDCDAEKGLSLLATLRPQLRHSDRRDLKDETEWLR